MVTASSCSPRLQAVSHGAGHTRPVNSGNGFVSLRRSYASSRRPAIEQVVDLGDEITQRTARHGGHVIEKAATLAKRHATIHAATRLLTLLVGGKRQHELPVIRHGLVRGTHAMLFACDLKVCSRASHPTPPLSATRRHAPVPPHERSPLPRAASSWQASCDTRPV